MIKIIDLDINTFIRSCSQGLQSWDSGLDIKEIFKLFIKNGYDLDENFTTINRKPIYYAVDLSNQLSNASKVFVKLLKHGASPFTYNRDIQYNPLFLAFSKCMVNIAKELLINGMGLLDKKIRWHKDMDSEIVYDSRSTYNAEILRDAEIVFKFIYRDERVGCDKEVWIHTVRELSLWLSSWKQLSPKDLKRVDSVCHNVLKAARKSEFVFAPGVVEAFSNYQRARMPIASMLERYMRSSNNVSGIVLGYMGETRETKRLKKFF